MRAKKREREASLGSWQFLPELVRLRSMLVTQEFVASSPGQDKKNLHSGTQVPCAQVPAGVGNDPDGRENVDEQGGRRLRHVQDDVEEEDHVGEGGVDAAVKGHPPLPDEPGHAGRVGHDAGGAVGALKARKATGGASR